MNLALSKRGDYVVRAAVRLARAHATSPDVQTKLREISADMGIPRTFVSQILGDLVHAGLAVSFAGKDGGYRLAREPEDVNLLSIVEAAEGPIATQACALGEGPCHWQDVCPLHETWSRASNALTEVLVSTTLAELAERDRRIEEGSYPVPADAHRLAPAPTGGVAVADSVHVELPVAVVAGRLGTGASWLAPHAAAASAEAAAGGAVEPTVEMRVGPGGPSWLGKTVRVHLGRSQTKSDGIALPLAWEATGRSGLFPRLDGELRLCAIDPERTELRLTGHYCPPFGKAGMVVDDALMARVARSTVRSFLRRVARALDEVPAEPPVTAVPEVSPVPAPRKRIGTAHPEMA
ncbi:MAG: Rrf2 family transcriptional regulator [Actinomycetota bacterium]|nr:Rrf2 family transcriptional regulator [Actinomycetota bacterium]